MLTLNRENGQSQVIRLDPAPGGVTGGDQTADEGGDLSLSLVDSSNPAAVLFAVTGLDADIETITVSFDGGATSEVVTLDGQGRFTADLSGRTGLVAATLTVQDDDGNTADETTVVTLGSTGDTTFIDAVDFTVVSAATGAAETIIRDVNDPSTHEANSTTDLDDDGLNDGYDGVSYLDPNGGPEDKASFTYEAESAGEHVLVLRMANGSGTAPRPIAVKTGDQSVAIENTNTGSFSTWQDFTVTLTLSEGPNTIVIAQTGTGAPNIDSVSVTPVAPGDTTADVGGDLALALIDATDPSAAIFEITGADADIASYEVSFDDGATSETVTPDAAGQFTADISGLSGTVTATLTVTDGASNTATASDSFDVESPDLTADEGGDLALSVVDQSDPANVVFAVAGLDVDVTSLSVSFDGGATSQVVTLEGGQFTANLSGQSGAVTAELTVTDDAANTASATVSVTLGEPGVPNDGTETVDGVAYVVYEAESAGSTGDPAVIDTAESDRGQRGGEFVDFLGPDDETITWTVEVAEAGTYAVDVIYALGPGKGPRPMQLSVDGGVVDTLQFPSNSDDAEDDWGPESTTVFLSAGVHTISVAAPGGVGPNVDYLRVSSAPVDVFVPSYAAVDGESRLELEATDGSTRTVDGSEVEFYFTVAEGGVYALDVAANAGAPDGAGLTFLLNGVEIGSDDFPGQGDAGEETVFAELQAGTEYKLTVVSDQPGASALDYLDVRAAPGDPNADIEIQSLDPTFYANRLHFSWLDNPDAAADSDRDFKESATVQISNSGTEPSWRSARRRSPGRSSSPIPAPSTT